MNKRKRPNCHEQQQQESMIKSQTEAMGNSRQQGTTMKKEKPALTIIKTRKTSELEALLNCHQQGTSMKKKPAACRQQDSIIKTRRTSQTEAKRNCHQQRTMKTSQMEAMRNSGQQGTNMKNKPAISQQQQRQRTRKTSKTKEMHNCHPQRTSMNNRKRPICHQVGTSMKRKRGKCQEEEEEMAASQTQATRNWLQLPVDVMFLIFTKIGTVEILLHAQFVSSLWRKLAKEPFLYRSLELADAVKYSHLSDPKKFDGLAKEAMNRSCGKSFKFSCNNFFTGELLHRVNLSNSNSLRCLQLGPLTCAGISGYGLADVLKDVPMLEEFELFFGLFPKDAIEQIGRSCPNLVSFDLSMYDMLHLGFDVEATCIAQNMPKLHSLGLHGSLLTSKGLQTILDGCPHLKRLDLRYSWKGDVDESLFKRCVDRIGDVSLPDESAFGWQSVVNFDTGEWVWEEALF